MHHVSSLHDGNELTAITIKDLVLCSTDKFVYHTIFPVEHPPGMQQMGQPMMGQPMMGQPMMGHPMMGQPMMGQPIMGQPMMGQPMMQNMQHMGMFVWSLPIILFQNLELSLFCEEPPLRNFSEKSK